jgi:hypothetical protein
MTTRTCNKCGREHPRTAWYWPKDARTADGFGAICKGCRKEQNKARRDRKRKEAGKLPRSKQDPETRREKNRQGSRRWRRENPEKVRDYEKERAARPERKQQRRVINHRRRLRIQLAKGGGFLPPFDKEALRRSQNDLCWLCDEPMGDDCTEHHQQAIAGPTPSLRPEHIVLVHGRCNSILGKKSLGEQLRLLRQSLKEKYEREAIEPPSTRA